MTLAQETLSLLVDASLKSLLLGLMACVAIRLTHNVNLQNRIAVITMLGMLTMPILVAITPSLHVPILAAQHQEADPIPSPTGELASVSRGTPEELEASSPSAGIASAAAMRPSPDSRSSASGSAGSRWSRLVTSIYAVVASLLFARLLLALRSATGLVRRSRRVHVRASFGLGKTVLMESDAVHVPLTFGVIRPKVLLPTDWRRWPEEKLDAVLTHESAHARRGDWLVAVLSEVNRALFWFHPLAWILRRFLGESAETCCDDAVLERLDDRTTYARHVLGFAREVAAAGARTGGPLSGRPMALSMASEPTVERRIVRILEAERPLARRIGAHAACLLGSGAVAVALLAASIVAVSPAVAADPGSTNRQPADRSQDGGQEHPIELVDTPEVNLDGNPALRIRVLDAATGEPLAKFLAVAGVSVKDYSVSEAFTTLHGKDAIVNWQPHLNREGTDGESLWSMARMYSQLGLRVEADGYLPMRYTWIDESRGAQTITFRLQRDRGITGRVVLPDGSPAAGAEVGIKMTQRNMRRKDCSFGFGTPLPEDHRDRWRLGVVVKADARGRFLLPTETDPSAFVVAIHESGTCQVSFDEFKELEQLELKAWGRVEGTVLIEKVASAGEKITLYDTRRAGPPYPEPFGFFYQVRSDGEGRFVIEHFPPGTGAAALPEYIPKNDGTGPAGWSYSPPIPEGCIRRFHVRSGETTVVTVGGEGLGPRRVEDESDQDDDGD